MGEEIKTVSKFPKERLRDNSKKIFGYESFIFDAAMMGKDGPFTKDEVKNRIEIWLKKEVK